MATAAVAATAAAAVVVVFDRRIFRTITVSLERKTLIVWEG